MPPWSCRATLQCDLPFQPIPLRLSQISPGVHRLATRYTNWYLLEAGGRLTVLDAGLPGDWREFSAALSHLGHALADIDAVLITHHHPDHAGNAERLRSSGARVLSHPADASYLRSERQLSNRRVVRFLWPPVVCRLHGASTGQGGDPCAGDCSARGDRRRGSLGRAGVSPSLHAPAIPPAVAPCFSRIDRSCSAATLS